tara:strand:+ start:420 stop:821 length:402 start_codon:yes stop_codon:yes gene_type:complete
LLTDAGSIPAGSTNLKKRKPLIVITFNYSGLALFYCLPNKNRPVIPFCSLIIYITKWYIFPALQGRYMPIYKIKAFSKWAKSEGMSDENIAQAVQEMNNGLFEANLGGNLYKKRVATGGGGKRGGFRTLLAFK